MKRWSLHKVWCQHLFESLEEHILGNYKLYARKGLAKLFLETLNSNWDKKFKYCRPESLNVLVTRIVDVIYDKQKETFMLKIEQLKAADDEVDLNDNKRVAILVAHSDLGFVLNEMATSGDYLVIWNCLEKGFSRISIEGNQQIELNRFDRMECSELLLYRHNGEISFPIDERGYIRNEAELDDFGVDVVYSQEVVSDSVQVYVQAIYSQSEVEPRKLKLAHRSSDKGMQNAAKSILCCPELCPIPNPSISSEVATSTDNPITISSEVAHSTANSVSNLIYEEATSTDNSVPIPSEVATSTDNPVPIPSEVATSTDNPVPIPSEVATSTDNPVPIPSEVATSTDNPVPIPSEVATSTDNLVPIPSDVATSKDNPVSISSEEAASIDHPVSIPSEEATLIDHPVSIPSEDPTSTDNPVPIPSEERASADNPVPIQSEEATSTDNQNSEIFMTCPGMIDASGASNPNLIESSQLLHSEYGFTQEVMEFDVL